MDKSQANSIALLAQRSTRAEERQQEEIRRAGAIRVSFVVPPSSICERALSRLLVGQEGVTEPPNVVVD